MIDIFAWIVLIVLIATLVAIFVALGMMPGHVAHKRGHPWAEAVAIGGWVTLIFGFVFWPLVRLLAAQVSELRAAGADSVRFAVRVTPPALAVTTAP